MSGDLPATAKADRFAWLDHARGIGIILVVYAHQLRAQTALGLVPANWDGAFQDALIYSFHMPLFFFISGIVSRKSIRDKPFAVSLADKLKTIAYPYFLWSILSWCLSALAVKYVNKPMDLSSLVAIVYQPILQFWFLYILFFCQLIALLLRKWFVLVVLIGAILTLTPVSYFDGTVKLFVGSFPFFAGGMLLSPVLLNQRPSVPWQGEAVAALIMLAIFVGLTLQSGAGYVPAVSIGRAWSGIAFVILVSRLIGARCSWLAALGRVSMAIFVLHTIVDATIRTILAIAGLHSPGTLFVTCVAGGLVVPIYVARLAARYGLGAWLGLGRSDRPARAVTTPALAVP